MKIAVLADIHANYPALEATVDHIERWQPDTVLVAGDLINRGPKPVECLHLIQKMQTQRGWEVIRGNHEEYVLWHSLPDSPREGPLFELFRYSYWTYEKLDEQAALLEAMPDEFSKNIPAAGEFRCVHASMKSNRRGIYPEMADETIKKLINPPPALLAVGHTHRPLIRQIGQTLVVNAGAVGLPFDADRRPAYAQITFSQGHWSAEIVRLNYDITQAKRDFYDTGFLDQAGPLSKIIQLELEISLSQLFQWTHIYMNAVLDEKISIKQAVDEYLRDPLDRPYW
ncbi:MAG: metallophosphoesterase family protein [Chloroflexi bacterium]|nr:metallophosphoesterase family protein [Chloroflexota bacterium]